MADSTTLHELGEILTTLPASGAVTDYKKVQLLEAIMPNTMNAWTHVVPVLAKYARHEGKLSFFGRDKGEATYLELIDKLRLVVLGLYGDRLLSRCATSTECLFSLLRSLLDFKEVYPNWNDAYSASQQIFVEESEKILPLLEKHQRSVEDQLEQKKFFSCDSKDSKNQEETESPFESDYANGTEAKTLREKAKDAPIALRILMDVICSRLERDFPQVITYTQWSNFVFAGTVAGTVALAIRLHYDVAENERTPLELEMREVLQTRFPNSEPAYNECYHFLIDSLVDIPRATRGKHLFVLLGLWVVAVVSDGVKIENEERIVGHIAEALQNETLHFWS